MYITTDMLSSLEASESLVEWFKRRFKEQDTEYQKVLDGLSADDRPDDAHWLMDRLGPQATGFAFRFSLTANTEAPKHLFVAGDLESPGDLSLAGWLRVGGHIEAQRNLRAEAGICAGASIRVGCGIRTKASVTSGGGITAGRSIEVEGSIHAAYAIAAGEDIRAGKEISAGGSSQKAIDALTTIYEQESELAEQFQQSLETLLEASGGLGQFWDSIASNDGPFGVSAGREIVAGADVACVGTLLAGESTEVGGSIQCGHAIKVGGRLCAACDIHAGGSVTAGDGIEVGGNLRFGADLKSEGDLCVAGSVLANEMSDFGSISALQGQLRAGGDIRCGGSISAMAAQAGGDIAADSIYTQENLTANGAIEARREVICRTGAIHSDINISSGKSIQAGDGIQTAGEIASGDGYGIFAGMQKKTIEGRAEIVLSKSSPPRLIHGHWIPFPDDDTETEQSTVIKIIGIGQSGVGAVERMIGLAVKGAEYLVASTQAAELSQSSAPCKIILNAKVSEADEDSGIPQGDLKLLADAIKDSAMVIIVAGKYDDAYAANRVARLVKKAGAFSIAVVVTPCRFETRRQLIFQKRIDVLAEYATSIMLIPGETLLSFENSKQLATHSSRSAEACCSALRSIVEIINVPGLVNADLGDVCDVLGRRSRITVGSASSSCANRSGVAADHAMVSLVRNGVEMQNVDGLLVFTAAARGLRMDEVNKVMASVMSYTEQETRIIYGAVDDEAQGEQLRVTVFASQHDWARKHRHRAETNES